MAEMHSAGIRATALAGLPCRILASMVLNAQHAAAAYADSGLNRRAAAGEAQFPAPACCLDYGMRSYCPLTSQSEGESHGRN